MSEEKQIKKIVEEFLGKMTISAEVENINILPAEDEGKGIEEREVINLNIKSDEPQILIGQQGQTLFEIQKILRLVLGKRLEKIFYLNLDINDYKKKKEDYLKELARSLADQVALSKEVKIMAPIPAYERRIIHAELSKRTDIATESQGDGPDRHIVIKPK